METNSEKPFQIVLADDHPVVLGALKNELSALEGFKVIAAVNNSNQLKIALKNKGCNLVVTDFSMPTGENESADGFAMIKKLRQTHPGVKVIVYTSLSNCAVIRRLYQMGVFAVVSKKEQPQELINACLAAQAKRKVYFSSSLRDELELNWALGDAFFKKKDLTCGELEVVRLFVGGTSMGDICVQLERTPSTVSTHKNNAIRKLGLTSDAELIKYAFTTGMI